MKKRLICFSIVLLILLSACTTNNQFDQSVEEEQMAVIPVGGTDNEILERSENISDVVVELFGIDDATTIILNDTAIVGVKMAYDQQLTDETKLVIEDKVLSFDKNITNVLITDKDKIFSEISDIIFNLLQGKSYDNYVNQISKIMNKIK
jgi:YhcN/YlaJ family sporulation lipoprotein